MAELTVIREYTGEVLDSTVYTNGGTYHKVIVENNLTGDATTKTFRSRGKAFYYAYFASLRGYIA